MTDENGEIEVVTAEAVLGIEVENLFESDVGKFILGAAEQDENDAMIKLMEFDPYQFTTLGELQSALAKIQQNVLISRNVQGYLSDAIIRGRQAEEIIANIED